MTSYLLFTGYQDLLLDAAFGDSHALIVRVHTIVFVQCHIIASLTLFPLDALNTVGVSSDSYAVVWVHIIVFAQVHIIASLTLDIPFRCPVQLV